MPISKDQAKKDKETQLPERDDPFGSASVSEELERLRRQGGGGKGPGPKNDPE
jgi:hypothetical protein